jgi:hypothetical protein
MNHDYSITQTDSRGRFSSRVTLRRKRQRLLLYEEVQDYENQLARVTSLVQCYFRRSTTSSPAPA